MRFRVIGIVVLTIAWTEPPTRANDINSLYGVVAFIPSPTRFDGMKDANIAWGRYDFSWRSVEAISKGTYNWEVQDYAVAEANRICHGVVGSHPQHHLRNLGDVYPRAHFAPAC